MTIKPAKNLTMRERVVDVARKLRFVYIKYIAGFEVPEEPHFDQISTPIFNELLDQTQFYLEFGSGGSTLAAARRGIDTLSVDSDAYFAKAVRRKLPKAALCKILIAPIGFTGAWGIPLLKRPTPRRLRNWRRYIDLPFEALANMEQFPDLILIDGRFRLACALECVRQSRKIGKPTIIFFDDYADRGYYHEIEQYLGVPSLIGRAAIFHVAHGPNIPEAAIAAAATDYR